MALCSLDLLYIHACDAGGASVHQCELPMISKRIVYEYECGELIGEVI